MPTTDQILDSIEGRLRELNAEIERLNAARAALGPADAVPGERQMTPSGPNGLHAAGADRPRPAPGPRRRRRRARRRSSFDVVPAGKLELLLSNTAGLTTSALAERANGDRDQVLVLLRELEASGRVRRTGERRGTRWHVITDEERIEQRAAELAALSRRAT